MEFLITDRKKITSLDGLLQGKHIVISVCCSHNDFPKLPENDSRLDTLQLRFSDLDNIEDVKKMTELSDHERILFTKEQAKEILFLVDKHIGLIETIVCQCDAGVSRSSGIAAALSKILNGDDMWVFNSKKYTPNMFVYRTIMNVYHNLSEDTDGNI